MDLDDAPDWHGSFEIPGRDAPPLMLSDVVVTGASVVFGIPEFPGAPVFRGMLGENGDSIRGTVTQNGRTAAFDLRRLGAAQVKAVPENSAVGAEFVGDWSGTVKLVQEIKLILHLRAEGVGPGSGSLDSVDGRARNLRLSAIAQSGAGLGFDVRLIGGHYEGKLMDGGRIEGVWTQNGRTVPLVFARLPK